LKGNDSIGVVARGTVYLTAGRITFLLSSVVIHLGLARVLDKLSYGVFGVLLGLLSVGQALIMGGSQYAVSKFVAEYPEKSGSIIQRSLRLQLWVTIPSMLGFIACAPFLASYFKDPSLAYEIRIVGFMLPVYGVFIVYYGALNGLRLFGYQALTQIGFNVSKVMLVFVLTLLGLGVSGVIAGYIGAAGFAMILAMCLLRSRLGRGTLPFGLREMALFALPVFVSSALSMVFLQMDLFLVKRILSDSIMTAEYTAAAAFGKIPYYLSASVAMAVFPSVASAVARKDWIEVKNYIRAPMRFTIITMALAAVCLATTSKQFIGFLYPAQFTMAHIPLGVLTGAIGLYSLLTLGCTVMNAAGEPSKSILAMGLALIGSYVGCTALIPRIGIMGAAVGMAIGASAGLLFIGTTVYANFKALCSPMTIFRAAMATVCAYYVGRFVALEGVLLVITYGAMTAVFLGILWISREIRNEDIQLLRSAAGLAGARATGHLFEDSSM